MYVSTGCCKHPLPYPILPAYVGVCRQVQEFYMSAGQPTSPVPASWIISRPVWWTCVARRERETHPDSAAPLTASSGSSAGTVLLPQEWYEQGEMSQYSQVWWFNKISERACVIRNCERYIVYFVVWWYGDMKSIYSTVSQIVIAIIPGNPTVIWVWSGKTVWFMS